MTQSVLITGASSGLGRTSTLHVALGRVDAVVDDARVGP
jgi:NAD(P)-dependent dehydrogenase (short-subunit alcohol dehydrogenase family)